MFKCFPSRVATIDVIGETCTKPLLTINVVLWIVRASGNSANHMCAVASKGRPVLPLSTDVTFRKTICLAIEWFTPTRLEIKQKLR